MPPFGFALRNVLGCQGISPSKPEPPPRCFSIPASCHARVCGRIWPLPQNAMGGNYESCAAGLRTGAGFVRVDGADHHNIGCRETYWRTRDCVRHNRRQTYCREQPRDANLHQSRSRLSEPGIHTADLGRRPRQGRRSAGKRKDLRDRSHHGVSRVSGNCVARRTQLVRAEVGVRGR